MRYSLLRLFSHPVLPFLEVSDLGNIRVRIQPWSLPMELPGRV